MQETITKTVESGAFIRTTIRKGQNKHQKTRRFTANDKKVTLCHIGDFEVYVYPYDFPDSVFIGAYPTSTVITAADRRQLISAYNKVTWFLNGNWRTEPKRRIAPNARRRSIVSAYNNGLTAQITAQNARIRHKL